MPCPRRHGAAGTRTGPGMWLRVLGGRGLEERVSGEGGNGGGETVALGIPVDRFPGLLAQAATCATF